MKGHKGDKAIARRPHQAQPPKKEGPRTNRDIRVPRVLLIDENGEKQGIMPVEAALEAAEEVGLDLVEVSPNADPPVCKIVDYGKLKYQEQKKKAEAKKKQKTVEIKEIKMRPNIDIHDYQVKTKAMTRFFEARAGAGISFERSFERIIFSRRKGSCDVVRCVRSWCRCCSWR